MRLIRSSSPELKCSGGGKEPTVVVPLLYLTCDTGRVGDGDGVAITETGVLSILGGLVG